MWQGYSSLTVGGGLLDLQQGLVSICSGGDSLCAMSRVSSPVVVVGHSPVLAGGLLSHCGHELLLSCGIGLLSSSGGYSGLFSRWRGDSSEGSMWEFVLSTCGIGGSSLVFTGFLHSSCDRLISSYFRGLVSICSRGTSP